MKSLLFLAIPLFIFACGQEKKARDVKDEQTAQADTVQIKDVSELTWREASALVFGEDEGERVEWHGEEMGNELVGVLSIVEAGPCGENGCGKTLQLISSVQDSIVTIMKADFDIKGDVGYMSRRYFIGPNDTLSIGCSHLCYNNESYKFSRVIVSSDYLKDLKP